MKHFALRNQIIDAARGLNATDLSAGTSGNVSARIEPDGGFLITPSGVPYEKLRAEDIVRMDMDGTPAAGGLRPSSEWRFHRDIYAERGAAKAIVHAHPPHATALACSGIGEIPAFHYMVAIAGGKTIRVAPYHIYGSEELSAAALKALNGRRACLLAHHGIIAFADTPEKALRLAVEVEDVAHQYTIALQLGTPQLLSEAEMEAVLNKFWGYGDNAQRSESRKEGRRGPKTAAKISYPKLLPKKTEIQTKKDRL